MYLQQLKQEFSQMAAIARLDQDIKKISINRRETNAIKIISNFDIIIISDYNKGLITSQFMSKLSPYFFKCNQCIC